MSERIEYYEYSEADYPSGGMVLSHREVDTTYYDEYSLASTFSEWLAKSLEYSNEMIEDDKQLADQRIATNKKLIARIRAGEFKEEEE